MMTNSAAIKDNCCFCVPQLVGVYIISWMMSGLGLVLMFGAYNAAVDGNIEWGFFYFCIGIAIVELISGVCGLIGTYNRRSGLLRVLWIGQVANIIGLSMLAVLAVIDSIWNIREVQQEKGENILNCIGFVFGALLALHFAFVIKKAIKVIN
eukprot:91035_1